MTRLCICKMCSCGRHRCTHKPTALYKKASQTNVLSEYSEKYPAYKGHTRPKSLKPQLQYKAHQDMMDGTTTFRMDYIPYPVTRRPERQQVVYKPKSGEIDLGTTYNQDFNPYDVTPFVPTRPKERIYSKNAKLDTIPTYKVSAQRSEEQKADVWTDRIPEMTELRRKENPGNKSEFSREVVLTDGQIAGLQE